MRILHTADWHVGKVLMGNRREDEHQAVLADLVAAAEDEGVDLVLVAGDVFDTVAPSPKAQGLVVRTLMELAQTRRRVVVIAGNHDNRRQWEYVFRPVLAALDIDVLGIPSQGGRIEVTTRGGETARLALLPFVSQQDAVRGAEVMTLTQAENQSLYRQVYQDMVGRLTSDWFSSTTVNLVVAHASLFGAQRGGGEREAQTIDTYCVGPEAFPDSCHYVALGHLHQRQQMPANVPIHYSGSPLQIDFGETRNASVAVIVDATHDAPASTTDRPVAGGRSLVTVPGTLDEL